MKLQTIAKVLIISSSLLAGVSAYANHTPDEEIVSTIQEKFYPQESTRGTKVRITSENGHVILSGTVETTDQANRLVEISESTTGVKNVDTRDLHVKESKKPLTDATITAKVKGTFMREKLLGDKDVSVTGVKVETIDRVVYLSGEVDTKEQADNAIRLAKSIEGVKKVVSKLKIQGRE